MTETDWYKWDDEKKSYVFNHRAKADEMNLKAPIPKSDIQRKAWKGSRWYKHLVTVGESNPLMDVILEDLKENDVDPADVFGSVPDTDT